MKKKDKDGSVKLIDWSWESVAMIGMLWDELIELTNLALLLFEKTSGDCMDGRQLTDGMKALRMLLKEVRSQKQMTVTMTILAEWDPARHPALCSH